MVRFGILGAADIAYNKFIPALNVVSCAECAGIASRNLGRTARFEEKFGTKIYGSYEEILEDPNVDAVYIPLPPAFHFEWAKKALLAGKHVYLEKPSVETYEQAKELADLAAEKNLVIQENYTFPYHKQFENVKEVIKSGKLGKIRLYKTSFGFPRRSGNDFRYDLSLGGGTMMDNGGYTVTMARELLGPSVKLQDSSLMYEEGLDIFGSASFVNDEGVVCQASFGMDCQYECSLEVWGSAGKLSTGRIYTPPAGFECTALLENGGNKENISLGEDDQFARAIEAFTEAMSNKELRDNMRRDVLFQSELVSQIIKNGGAINDGNIS